MLQMGLKWVVLILIQLYSVTGHRCYYCESESEIRCLDLSLVQHKERLEPVECTREKVNGTLLRVSPHVTEWDALQVVGETYDFNCLTFVKMVNKKKIVVRGCQYNKREGKELDPCPTIRSLYPIGKEIQLCEHCRTELCNNGSHSASNIIFAYFALSLLLGIK